MAAKVDPKIIMIQKFKGHISTYMKRNRIFQTLQHRDILFVILPPFLDRTVCCNGDQLEAAQNGWMSRKHVLCEKVGIICIASTIKLREGKVLTVFQYCFVK